MIYLDNAATTFPKPPEVIESITQCMKTYCGNPGRGSHRIAIRGEEKIIECREEIAELFNIDNIFDICFTKNATEGLNYGIMNYIGEEDHIITTTAEHNSVLRPVNYLKENGTEVTFLKTGVEGYLDLDKIKDEIKENTKMIIINHASNVLGTVQDIESIGKLARENGIIFMVDASQSAGVIDIDVERDRIDIMAMPGHKGLYGPQGTGVLFIRDEIDITNKTILGGTGSNSNSMIQPDFMPDKFESGTVNLPGIVGLCEGIRYIKKKGISKIGLNEMRIIRSLHSELSDIPEVQIYGDFEKALRTGVLSFNIEGFDSSDVGNYLSNKGVYVRTGYHCAPLIHKEINTELRGTIRASIGVFNTEYECKVLARFVKKIVKERL